MIVYFAALSLYKFSILTRYIKWIGLAAAVLLVISCWMPWIEIPSRNITVTGVDATGTNFGKPGFFNLAMVVLFVFFSLVQRVWAKRANLLVVGLNFAWALKNFLLLPACEGGECPEKKLGIILMFVASFLLLIAGLFPDMRLKKNSNINP